MRIHTIYNYNSDNNNNIDPVNVKNKFLFTGWKMTKCILLWHYIYYSVIIQFILGNRYIYYCVIITFKLVQ